MNIEFQKNIETKILRNTPLKSMLEVISLKLVLYSTPALWLVNILKINSGFWSYHCSSTGLLSIVKRTTSFTKKGPFKTWCFTLWLLKGEWKTINRFILEYLVSFNHTGLPEISFQVQYNLQHTNSIKNVLVITF